MAASVSDYFQLLGGASSIVNSPKVTIARTGGGTTLTVDNCNWDTTTGKRFATYQVDTSNKVIAGTQTIWKGIVTSSTTIGSLARVSGASDTGNSIGDIVELLPASDWARQMVTGITQFANQDGTLIGSVIRTALGETATTGAGWTSLGYAPNTITASGNRSYSIVYNGVDLTGTLSAGMRLRHTRTVAAPTQCTSLNGTTQFYNKTSPAGMTFTNNFVVSACVKLTSYAVSSIASRYNGTSGWDFQLDASGRPNLIGINAGGTNFKQTIAYQSVPLNKWVHVAAQLDMSSSTISPTVNYIMIDGVDVPATQNTGGTNPTALIQAGNLEIGSRNAGLQPFPGKIAQVAIYSAKVTEANILATISQGLAGTETSLISAYSFNNSINDLNANANNLTANGSAVATNADSPFGGQADGTISSTLDYAIITKTAFSTNTTLTVQAPEGCTIPTSGGVSAVSYATVKTPYGMPIQKDKWTLLAKYKVDLAQSSAVNGTWYNPNSSLSVPIGEWLGQYEAQANVANSSATPDISTTLSTANNSETDNDFRVRSFFTTSNATLTAGATRNKNISVAATQIYYLNIKSDQSGSPTLTLLGTVGPIIITAELAYL